MGGLIEIASRIMSDASRSSEAYAQNIANMTTPGYKRRIDFAQTLSQADFQSADSFQHSTAIDWTPGKVVETSSPYDLALSGEGFFVLRSAEGAVTYTRDGQFRRDDAGRLVSSRGGALQAEGRDLVLRGSRVEVLPDGMVVEDGQPVARLDVMAASDPGRLEPAETGGFAAPEEMMGVVEAPRVTQGAVEGSNISTAAEMISVMAAVRRAESGQRLAKVYDELMDRVITKLGDGE